MTTAFEHEVRIQRSSVGWRVHKQFARPESFWAEVAGLSLAAPDLVPELLRADISCLVVVRGYVRGAASSLPWSPSVEMAVLATLCRLHATRVGSSGHLVLDPQERWTSYIARRAELRIQSLRLRTADETRLSAYVDAHVRSMPVHADRLLHHDLNPTNVIVQSTDRRAILIDFEHSIGGDPASDLAKLRWRAFSRVGVTDRWQRFRGLYEEHSGTEVSDAVLDFYETMHAIGSIAFWRDLAGSAPGHFGDLAREAASIAHARTGVKISAR